MMWPFAFSRSILYSIARLFLLYLEVYFYIQFVEYLTARITLILMIWYILSVLSIFYCFNISNFIFFSFCIQNNNLMTLFCGSWVSFSDSDPVFSLINLFVQLMVLIFSICFHSSKISFFINVPLNSFSTELSLC